MERRFGIKRGIKNGKLETAKAMIKDNVKFEIIERYTGLRREEINKLCAEKV